MTEARGFDAGQLTDFLRTEFPQVASQFTVLEAAPMEVLVALDADESHLRPGGTVSGPSMFSLADNSSKVALAALTWAMRQRGLELLDCQVSSDHLQTMGAELIPREEFNSLLVSLVQPPYERGPWSLPGTYMATEALL